jgi:hypothetical protein
MANSTSPSIFVTLAIEPPTFLPGAEVELSITAVSHASSPITIFAWPNIFNLQLAQRRGNFTCVDLNTGIPLKMESTKGPKRPGFSRRQGGIDDAHFHTLVPEQPLKLSGRFLVARRSTEGSRAVTPGHRYRFGVRDGEKIAWWREGSKDEVMSTPDEPASLGDASGEPIALSVLGPVEFTILSTEA